jgi:acyl transferase domain-containing protein
LKDRAIAIVGMSCLFPKAGDLNEYWANVREGVDAVGDVPATHWDPADYYDADESAPDKTYARRGGFLDPVDFAPLQFGISPRDVEAIDTSQLLGLMVARDALDDAGYGDGGKAFDRDRTSVMLGVTGTLEAVVPLGARLSHPLWRRALAAAGVDPAVAEDVVARIAEGYVPWQENSFPGLLGNVVAGRIANRLDLRGTNSVCDAACASSLAAVHSSVMELLTGRADMVLTGGIDTFNDIFMYMCFSKTPALSPTGDCKPFAADGDGTILGEGLGMLVLKRLEDAERDGDRIYAVIRGLGTSSDGKGNAVYAPSASGQARCLDAAYRDADVDPGTIELIEAHGTGTMVGDATEIEGLTQVFRKARADGTWCALGSVKSMIGHTKAAAGAAGLIKAAMALYERVLPPTIKVDRPNAAAAPGETPFYVNTAKRPWLPARGHPRRAGVSAFGFGGSNFHCVLEEYAGQENHVSWDGRTQILAFSGEGRAELEQALDAFQAGVGWSGLTRSAARSRQSFDPSRECRLLIVVERDGTPLPTLIAEARSILDERGIAANWSSPRGVFFGHGRRSGGLAALFPGQGAQSPGMVRDLACMFPEMQSALADADAAAADGPVRLSDLIHPHPAFDDDEAARQVAALRATDVAQPTLGAVSLGAWRVLQRFGVRFDAAAGHSYGELVALCAAGRLTDADLHRLSQLRGRLMSAGEGDRGAMLAVLSDRDAVVGLLARHELDLVVANRNSPRQIVLSGATAEIDRAEALFGELGLTVRRLEVAAAFHSPLVAEAAKPFGNALSAVDLHRGDLVVYSNTTGAAYPDDDHAARALLAGQLAAPVEFVPMIDSLFADGARTFVEVGPGCRLGGLVDEILEAEDVSTLAIDASSGARSGQTDLARLLAALAARGHAVDLERWDEGRLDQPEAEPAGFTISLCGANYRESDPASSAMARPPISGASSQPGTAPSGLPATQPRLPSAAAPLVEKTMSEMPVDPSLLTEALRASREGLAALMQMQQQTAELHRRFLEGQERTAATFQSLLQQQQSLAIGGEWSPPPALPTAPVEPSAGAALPGVPVQPALPTFVAQPAPLLQPAPTLQSTPTQPAPEQPAAPAAILDREHVSAALLSVVSDKTGYPAEMLDLSMGMDSDLGIDSIKRVEILSAIQEVLPAAPVVKPEHLGELKTLGQLVDFLAPGSSSDQAAATRSPSPQTAPGTDREAVSAALLAVVADKTGYPVEMLDLTMGMDADLGIDSIKRVEILSAIQERLPSAPVVKPENLGTLKTLGQLVDFLSEAEPSGAANGTGAEAGVQVAKQQTPAEPDPVGLDTYVLKLTELPEPPKAKSFLAAGGRLWVSATEDGLSTALAARWQALGLVTEEVSLDGTRRPPDDLVGLIVVAPTGPCESDLPLRAFDLVRRCGPALRAAAGSHAALLASVSRVDGRFGLGDVDGDPLSGCLAGLIKSAHHEWSAVTCRAFDVAPALDDQRALAEDIVAHMLCPGPVEVGLHGAGACTPELVPTAVREFDEGAFGEDDVVVISGGARGITAEVALSLSGSARLVLLGRSPLPGPEAEWLTGLDSEGSVKAALAARSTPVPTPRKVQQQWREIAAARELRRNLARIEDAGSPVQYHAVDVRDKEAVARVLQGVRQEWGAITAVVHAAGVLADRNIDDKSDDDVTAVFGTKVDGLISLLAAVGDDELSALVLFSSTTARFGRRGQADYAMANEALEKLARAEARRRPGCRVISFGWGPWDGGMVDASLRRLFADEGISVIAPAAGAALVAAELAAPSGPAELIVLGRNSRISPTLAATWPGGAAPARASVTTLTRALDVQDHAFLKSHVLDGKAVLPVAVMIEWLGHAALHGNPGLRLVGLDGLAVYKGVLVEGSGSLSLAMRAQAAVKRDDGSFTVSVELVSEPETGRPVVHATVTAVLSSGLPEAVPALPVPELQPFGHTVDEAYGEFLFHGPLLHGIQTIDGCDDTGIVATALSHSVPAEWMERPLRSRWIAEPLAIDSAFQLLILWSLWKHDLGSLPTRFESYRQYRADFPEDGVRIEVRITQHDNQRVVADIDWLDAAGAVVARMTGYECVLASSLTEHFARNTLSMRQARP